MLALSIQEKEGGDRLVILCITRETKYIYESSRCCKDNS